MSGSGPEQPPKYTKYRARRNPFKKDAELRSDAPAQPGPQLRPEGEQPYVVHGRKRRPWQREPQAPGTKKRISKGRIAKWLAIGVVGWIGFSLVLFLISAQIQQGKVDDATEQALDGGGLPLGSSTTVLVLGSDQRSKDTKEPGASTSGPSRSDSIMLLRVGGGANSRLSIARDTIVDIPGNGRQKINAAYAIGGAGLAIETVKQYLGIDVNHVIEVSFSEFPGLIDAMGGIDYQGGCVVAKVNGGYANGGVTIRIKAGEQEHLNGKQALALARIRKNDCNKAENDLTRARRQQRIISAMKSRVIGVTPPHGFIRLPWISWQVPRTFKTDMSGPTLLAVFADLAVGGSPETNVLGTLDGNVPEDKKNAAVKQFMDG
jgi:LCP family protein required for cell wall assembly